MKPFDIRTVHQGDMLFLPVKDSDSGTEHIGVVLNQPTEENNWTIEIQWRSGYKQTTYHRELWAEWVNGYFGNWRKILVVKDEKEILTIRLKS